jgi:outer membrane receptor protein involved in Fe transport
MSPRSWSARSALIAGLVHLYLGYQINPDALASFALENLFNKQYSRYLVATG